MDNSLPQDTPAPQGRQQKKDQIIMMLQQGYSYNQIKKTLHCARSTIAYHAELQGLRKKNPNKVKASLKYDWNEVQQYYDEGHTARECGKKFGFSPGTWVLAVKEGRINPHHSRQRLSLEKLLSDRGKADGYHIKARLLQAGVLENKCNECGISEWNGKDLVLHLDHINGNSRDHRLENLRLLCPNCHSQTDTYCGRNGRHRT